MRRKKTLKNLPSESSDDDEPLSKKVSKAKKQTLNLSANNDSSSESDIENYLQPADKIDLDSPFFNIQKGNNQLPSSETKNDVLPHPVTNSLSVDSNNEISTTTEPSQESSKFHFQQLHEYARKIEEMKKCAEEYKTKKQNEAKQTNVSNLLAMGESKPDKESVLEEFQDTLHSSDFESYSDSEKEGWEEVKDQQKVEENVIPKEGLQITVEMPGPIRKKKKQVDVMVSIKRRINRIKKEHQVLIHKVHLLCWIAHGNYVSSLISSPNILTLALSLIPSELCRSAKRTDLDYIKQLLEWYHNTVTIKDAPLSKEQNLRNLLETQIAKNEVHDKKMMVYLLVAILRSLKIQCRLVLSFIVEPLRPPDSELISLSTKNEKSKAGSSKKRSDSGSRSSAKENDSNENLIGEVSENKKTRSKSTNEISQLKVDDSKKSRSKSTSEVAVDDKNKIIRANKENKIAELDKEIKKTRSKKESDKKTGSKSVNEERNTRSRSDKKKKENLTCMSDKLQSEPNNKSKTANSKLKSSKEIPSTSRTLRSQKKSIPQIDGANDSNSDEEMDSVDDNRSCLHLKKEDTPSPRRYSKRLKTIKNIQYKDTDSEDEFSTRSPFSNKNKDSPQINGNGNSMRKMNNKESPKINGRDNLKKTKLMPQKIVKAPLTEGKQTKLIDKKSANDRIDSSNANKERKQTQKKRRSGSKSDEDSDYIPEVAKKKRRESEDDFLPKMEKATRKLQTKRSNSGEEKNKRKQGIDVWIEVFVDSEKKWISVDVVKGQVDCVNEIFARATQPVSYVIAWNNNNCLKDVTGRYCQNFNTATRKLRVDTKWWEETLKPFLGPKTARDKKEDDELEKLQLEKPLPKSIAEYKNHPLYVLKRHLLKYEAIYPPDAPTLGFVRGEPVYSRQCVYILHSRDIWLKKAKVVRLGEKPYKIVKANPKYDRLSNTIITDQLLDIFGPWQVEDYVPPTAENGVVPRNAFGNVDLFLPSMLPKKTVHLKLPGLNKVAKRMNIDCASAIVGFDFHGGWSHPVYDGFVVCEEYADILAAAWELEQDELEKKEQEKIDKRVYGNWKRLIKGLLIRERLKVKYEFGETSEDKGKKKSKGGSKATIKKKKTDHTECESE